MHQFQPEPTHKIHEQHHKEQLSRYPPKERLSNDNKDHHNHHMFTKLRDEIGHHLLSLTESQWKLKHNQNFPMEGKPL